MSGVSIIESPVGRVAAHSDGSALVRVRFLGPDERVPTTPPDAISREAADQLHAYFSGDLRVFVLKLAPKGTPFQQDVWRALQTVPYGATTTYADIAERVGRPTAIRAVGAANGANPIAIVIPCHRIIGRDGTLTGYAGGLDRKRVLLDLEARAR